MTSKELKKLLRKTIPSLKKPIFGNDPIQIFDTDIDDDFSFAEMNHMVQVAVNHLKAEGYDPDQDYEEDRADCDNWARWIQTEVTKQYSKNMRGKPNKGTVAFSFAVVPGHGINVGICRGVIYAWNYGRPYNVDGMTFQLVDFY